VPSLRRMSGQAVLAVFQSLGFEVQSQKGSHVKLRRVGPNGERQTLTIPNHSELDTGTLRAIIRQAARYVAMVELQRNFYR
jgi:predicted RNA binding protein YcfA (HicA-like mRNA interferase family)